MPFFSILIPSYNRPAYLVECIESVLANKGEDFEIIISDDASPTAEAIATAVRPYVDKPNIRFHRQPTNFGEPANRNYLVAQATGRYNIILGDDDLLFPHALRTIRSYIDRLPDEDIYMFGYRVIDDSGISCYTRVAPGPLAIHLDHPELVRRMFEGTWLPFLVCHPATFCSRRGIETTIPYRQDVSTADDYMFLLECLNQGKRLYVIPESLMSYRWFQSHTANQINQSSNKVTVLQAYTKVYYMFQQRADLHPLIAGLVSSPDYRKRFLYEQIVCRLQITDDTLRSLKLLPAHRLELCDYVGKPWNHLVIVKTAWALVYDLVHIFGMQGLVCSIHAAIAYLRYRVLREWASPGI